MFVIALYLNILPFMSVGQPYVPYLFVLCYIYIYPHVMKFHVYIYIQYICIYVYTYHIQYLSITIPAAAEVTPTHPAGAAGGCSCCSVQGSHPWHCGLERCRIPLGDRSMNRLPRSTCIIFRLRKEGYQSGL